MVLLLLLALCLLAHSRADVAQETVQAIPSVSSVVEIDSKNSFNFFGGPKLLVEFYAPGCDHCQRFSETYGELAAELDAEGAGFKVGKVDVSANAAISGRFSVESIPTIFLYRDGQTWQYSGGALTKQSVKDWAMNPTHAPMSILASPFGPIGKAKGAIFSVGVELGDLTVEISDRLGISHMFGIVLAGLFGGILVLVITLAGIFISLPAHEKRD